jgi:hypothetical protein
MKAWRNLNGNVVEIEVDQDTSGSPILPPDTTTAERPAAQDGHYVTVVGNEWVQIPVPVAFISFESKKAAKLDALKAYRTWALAQPVEHDGVKFDADDNARTNLIQALVIYGANSYLPPAWVAYDNTLYPLPDVAAFNGIVTAVQTAFGTRFFEAEAVRQQLMGANNEDQLAAAVVPTVPMNNMF